MGDQPEQQRYGRLARLSVFWAFVREGTNSLLTLPTSIILARLLSPSEFGVAAIAYFFLHLSGRLTQLGFNASLIRMKEVRGEHTSTVFVTNLVLALLAWAGLIALAPWLAAFVRSEQAGQIIPVAGLTFVLSAFGVVPGTLLSRQMRYREHATSEWVGTATNSVVAILLAWAGYSFWSIVYGHLANDFARAAAKLYFARWQPRLSFSSTAFRELLSFGAGMYVKNLLEYTASNIDNLIIGRLLGMSSLGLYDKAYGLMARVVARLNLAGPAASFRIFSLIHEDHERLRRGYRKVVLAVTLLGYPAFTILIMAAPELILALFGSRWAGSVLPFQILCGSGMLRLLNTYASTATQAKGRIWSEVWRQFLSTALLAASVAAFSRWGVAGAATGVLLATCVSTLLLQEMVRRLTRLQWRDLIAPQLPGIICSVVLAVVMGSARYLLVTWWGGSPALVIVAVIAMIGAGCYVAFVLFCGFKDVHALVYETLGDISPLTARRLRASISGQPLTARVE